MQNWEDNSLRACYVKNFILLGHLEICHSGFHSKCPINCHLSLTSCQTNSTWERYLLFLKNIWTPSFFFLFCVFIFDFSSVIFIFFSYFQFQFLSRYAPRHNAQYSKCNDIYHITNVNWIIDTNWMIEVTAFKIQSWLYADVTNVIFFFFTMHGVLNAMIIQKCFYY